MLVTPAVVSFDGERHVKDEVGQNERARGHVDGQQVFLDLNPRHSDARDQVGAGQHLPRLQVMKSDEDGRDNQEENEDRDLEVGQVVWVAVVVVVVLKGSFARQARDS